MAASEPVGRSEGDGSRPAVIALQVLIGVFTPLALISIGGVGIYAAPLLLPLLWLTANACRGGGRWYFTVLAALTAAESAWAISWSLFPTIQLLLPVLAAAGAVLLFIKTHRSLPLGTTVVVLAALGALGLAGIASLAADDVTTTRETNFERGS